MSEATPDLPTYVYKVGPQGIYRNNRLYAPGEIIQSKKVVVSKGLLPQDPATMAAVKAKKAQLEAERAKTPTDLRLANEKSRAENDRLARENDELRARLLKLENADLTAKLAERESAAEPAAAQPQHPDDRQKSDFLGNPTQRQPAKPRGRAADT